MPETKSIYLLHDKSTLRFDPFFGGLGATCVVHLRLTGKPTVEFLLVIIELFSLGAMVEALRANIDWKSPFVKGWVGSLWPKISGGGDIPHQPFVHG